MSNFSQIFIKGAYTKFTIFETRDSALVALFYPRHLTAAKFDQGPQARSSKTKDEDPSRTPCSPSRAYGCPVPGVKSQIFRCSDP